MLGLQVMSRVQKFCEYILFVTLESKIFQLSRTKTEFKECKFSKSRNKDEGAGRPDGQEKGG